MNTIRFVLALATHLGWNLHKLKLDVKNIFYLGNLEKRSTNVDFA